MPLRIAFDLDGVLADMESELVRQAETLFGETLSRRLQQPVGVPDRTAGRPAGVGDAEPDPGVRKPDAGETALENTPPLLRLNLTSKQQRKLWRHVESIENFWETLKEIEPGAIARLAKIAEERRWEVIFLTKRPQSAGRTAQVQTQRWLCDRGFPLPSVFVVQGSRGRIAASLDLTFVVDDRPENCLDVVVDSRARAILVWREDETRLPVAARRLGIGVVRTTAECLDILAEADSPQPEDAVGMMDRVKRLLGLSEPARP